MLIKVYTDTETIAVNRLKELVYVGVDSAYFVARDASLCQC